MRKGIRIKTQHHMTKIRKEGDHLVLSVKEEEGGEVGAGLCVWSTGLMQNPLVQQLMSQEIRLPSSSSTGAKAEAQEEVHNFTGLRDGDDRNPSLPGNLLDGSLPGNVEHILEDRRGLRQDATPHPVVDSIASPQNDVRAGIVERRRSISSRRVESPRYQSQYRRVRYVY